ncbi:MAG TPA: flavodoxin domain-containing protein [Candidatus Brocadiales bacterium]|nr:flavodoxin domain-containing protein [Candidatus Brocadiales bacterium]
MNKIKIAEGVYWVGAIDWNARSLHGGNYTAHHGTSYNAYLIIDEKITLVDTVHGQFAEEMIARIKEVIDPVRIDYVVCNHIEPDHSGALPAVMKIIPQAKVICTIRGKEGLLKHYFGNWNFLTVKTGDEISIGKKTLRFIEASLLHWPDTMFTYIKEDALLLPNDAFGQHFASSQRFADEVEEGIVMDEAAKYYANILMPFASLVVKKLEEIQKSNIQIKTIAPSHGLVWRENPEKIINAYLRWAKGEAKKQALVIYETIWGSTEKMAMAILQGIQDDDVEARLYKISATDHSDIIKEVLEAKAILIGSPTVNNSVLPNVASLLEELKELKPTGKIACAFGSYGWGSGAVRTIEEKFKQAGMEIFEPGLTTKWVPDADELKKCHELGKRIAVEINEHKVRCLPNKTG